MRSPLVMIYNIFTTWWKLQMLPQKSPDWSTSPLTGELHIEQLNNTSKKSCPQYTVKACPRFRMLCAGAESIVGDSNPWQGVIQDIQVNDKPPFDPWCSVHGNLWRQTYCKKKTSWNRRQGFQISVFLQTDLWGVLDNDIMQSDMLPIEWIFSIFSL